MRIALIASKSHLFNTSESTYVCTPIAHTKADGLQSITDVDSDERASREEIMSILFVLLTFLLVITITYFPASPGAANGYTAAS